MEKQTVELTSREIQMLRDGMRKAIIHRDDNEIAREMWLLFMKLDKLANP